MRYRHHFFICHERRGLSFAKKLADALSPAGAKAWIDRHQVPGAKIWDEVETALKHSQHLVVVLSGALSEWQKREIAAFLHFLDTAARKRGSKERRLLIPVQRTSVKLPPLLIGTLARDARKLTPRELAKQLFDEIVAPSQRKGRRSGHSDPVLDYRERVAARHSRLVPFLPEMSDVLLEHSCVELEIESRGGEMRGFERETVRRGKGSKKGRDDRSLDALIENSHSSERPARWLVESEPGAGKTTIARNLARHLASDAKRPFPIFVSATELAKCEGDLARVALSVIYDDPASAPRARRAKLSAEVDDAWLLIDGFDEVPSDLRKSAYDTIDKLGKIHRGPIVVMARFIAFEKRDPWPEFRRAKILGLDEKRQRTLIEKLGGKDLIDKVLEAAAANDRVRDIAKNPLLLSLLTIVAREAMKRGTDVPTDDGLLMERAVRLLLERGFGLEPRKVKDVGAARNLLGALSLQLHRKGGEIWTPPELSDVVWELRSAAKPDLKDSKLLTQQLDEVWKGTDAFLEDIEFSGVIGPHDGIPDMRRYLHRSIREYLAAERLKKLPKARATQLFHAFVKRPRDPKSDSDKSWAEVFRYWLALTDAPKEWIGKLTKTSADVASRTVRRTANLSKSERLKIALDADKNDGVDLLGAALGHPDPDVAAELVLERAKPEITTEQAGRLLWTLERLGREPKDFFARISRWPAPSGLIEFVEIPAGTFEMGADPIIDGDEEFMQRSKPLHRVSVPRFALAKTQVTRAQYRAFAAKHESKMRGQVPKDEVDRLPVTGLSWWEAYLFSRWIGGRLPSEAEWEYACRANTKERMRYSFGNDEESLTDHAWYFRNSGAKLLPLGTPWDHRKVDGEWAVRPHPVGLKLANPFGLFDMHGNAWEWCADSGYPNYDGAPPDGSPWLNPASPFRVIRGGSFWNAVGWLRSAIRGGDDAGIRGDGLGFRPARPLSF